jgi:hypothetical protein
MQIDNANNTSAGMGVYTCTRTVPPDLAASPPIERVGEHIVTLVVRAFAR